MSALTNKIALITGGGGGIGGAIARFFAKEGANIALVDINGDAARSVAKEISGQGGTAISLVADVTDKESVQQMLQTTTRQWGKIDILLNVAGGAEPKPVVEMTEADWDRIVNMNLKSVFLCCQAALPLMIDRHYGKIVSISSIYGFTGNATRANYAAAKAGVAVFTKSLALEVIQHGINVNAIAPGRVATERVRGRYSDQEWADRIAAIPMGRAATPQELAPAALFLVNDENNYVTGQTIHVNGAWLNY